MNDLLNYLGIHSTASDEAVLHAFLRAVKHAHPDQGGNAAKWLDLIWAYLAARDRKVYAQNMHAWKDANPRPNRLTDWRAWVIGEVHAHLENALAGVGEALDEDGLPLLPDRVWDARARIVRVWEPYMPLTWDMDRIAWVAGPPEALDVHGDLAALLRLPEFDRARGATFQVVYHLKAKKRHDKITLASIKPISPAERDTWPTYPAPLFKLQIWWPWWATLGTWTSPRGYREARYRLLHHELGHALLVELKGGARAGRGLGHDVEEFGATLARFGATTVEQAALLAAGYQHPTTQRLLAAVPEPVGAFLRPREDEEKRERRRERGEDVPTRRTVGVATFHADVRELASIVRDRASRRGEVDFGAAPWAEASALLDVLQQQESRPTLEQLASLEKVCELLFRWAPGT